MGLPPGDTIAGPDFDTNITNTGGYMFIPPDPIGAAGPNHLVSVVNVTIEWHTKQGVEQNSQSLKSFFTSLSPLTFLFDPKVIYDQHAGRFVVVALEMTDVNNGDPANTSRILLAVSDDSDPNGSWYFFAIDSKTNIGGTDHWADYPGLAVDADVIYVTNNMFTFGTGSSGGVRLWIINKNPFYSGGAATFTVHDPDTETGASPTSFTLQPAHIFGAAPAGVGTFLVMYSGLTSGINEFIRVFRVDNPLASPSFNEQTIALGNIDRAAVSMPDAPQLGSSTLIETNDRRALHAVWRNNSLWMVTTIVPASLSGPDAGEATAHWIQIDTSNLGSLSLLDQGNIGGEDIGSGTYTFFPSIAVDSSGNVGIGFAASSPNIYAGAYYTGRLATDAAGTVQATEVLAAGEDYYVRKFGGSRNRWGDYSGISLDPTDDKTFWVFNEYAMTRGTALGGEDGRWATRWGSFSFNPQITVSKTGDYGGGATTPGATNVSLLQLGVIADAGAGTISGIKVDFTDSSTAQDSDIASLDVHEDANADGTVDGGDTMLGSATFSSGTATVTGLSLDVTATMKHLLLSLNIANTADPTRIVGLKLADTSYISTSHGGVSSTNFPIANSSDTALPVELTIFTAEAIEEGVVLRWQTGMEIGNLGFSVYREQEESEPVKIGYVKGSGSSGGSRDYKFTDRDVVHGEAYTYFLEDVSVTGARNRSRKIEVVFKPQEFSAALPTKFRLWPSYPNPFNPDAWFPYELASEAYVVFKIYNANGQLVRQLDIGRQSAGRYIDRSDAIHWDGRDEMGQRTGSGMYFYQLTAGSFTATRKMVLVK